MILHQQWYQIKVTEQKVQYIFAMRFGNCIEENIEFINNNSNSNFYHPRMWVGNVFGHVCLSVCLSVCMSVCLSVCLCFCLFRL